MESFNDGLKKFIQDSKRKSLISMFREYKMWCELEKKLKSGEVPNDSLPLSMIRESLHDKDVQDELFKRLRLLDK